MKTAIHVCILLVLSAAFSLTRAADVATENAPLAEPDRSGSNMFEMHAVAQRTPGD